jgi:hypothetical protein
MSQCLVGRGVHSFITGTFRLRPVLGNLGFSVRVAEEG